MFYTIYLRHLNQLIYIVHYFFNSIIFLMTNGIRLLRKNLNSLLLSDVVPPPFCKSQPVFSINSLTSSENIWRKKYSTENHCYRFVESQ